VGVSGNSRLRDNNSSRPTSETDLPFAHSKTSLVLIAPVASDIRKELHIQDDFPDLKLPWQSEDQWPA